MGRTKKNIQLKTPEKPRKIKGFRNGGFPIATTISSQPRYDHFDTAAYQLNQYTIHFPAAQRIFLRGGEFYGFDLWRGDL